jgi:hypothetical protein
MPVPMDFLQQIGQLLGLTPQPAQAATPQPIQTPAGPSTTSIVGPGGAPAATPTPATTPAATSPGGLTGFLSNPLVEGALGAGLGYLAQPRGQGLKRRLGVAGLTGLEGFESAEAAQAKLPQQQAELQKTQAEAQVAQQKAAYGKQHPDSAGPADYLKLQAIKENNANLAREFQGGSANLPPDQRKIADAIAATAYGSTKALTYKDLIDAHIAAVKDPYALKEVLADLAAKKAKTAADTARAGYENAAATRVRASAPIGAARAGRTTDPALEFNRVEGAYHKFLADNFTDPDTGLRLPGAPSFDDFRSMLPGLEGRTAAPAGGGSVPPSPAGITFPPHVTSSSAAVKYLMETKRITRPAAIAYLRNHPELF